MASRRLIGDAHRLFQIVNHRYERSSTIITSNKSITEWPAMLAGGEALAAAILEPLEMTDAVEKVGLEQAPSNNRIEKTDS